MPHILHTIRFQYSVSSMFNYTLDIKKKKLQRSFEYIVLPSCKKLYTTRKNSFTDPLILKKSFLSAKRKRAMKIKISFEEARFPVLLPSDGSSFRPRASKIPVTVNVSIKSPLNWSGIESAIPFAIEKFFCERVDRVLLKIRAKEWRKFFRDSNNTFSIISSSNLI